MRALFERLSPDYWWSDPTVAWDGTGVVVFAMALMVLFLGAATLLILGGRMPSVVGLSPQLIGTLAAWVLGIAATGLLLLLFRWQMTPFFGRRLWFFLWLATGATFAAVAARATLSASRRSPS